MDRVRWFTFVIVAIMLALVVSPTPTPKALAGSNGQQIHFKCSSNIQGVSAMDYAIIRGSNQNSKYMEWKGKTAWSGDRWSTFVFTANYWWVGQVRIYWWNPRTNSWNSSTYYVPPKQ